MADTRLTKKIFLWDTQVSEISGFPTWSKEVREVLERNEMTEHITGNIFNSRTAVDNLTEVMLEKDKKQLQEKCKTLPKLRTYNQIVNYSSDNCYLTKPL